MKAIQVQAQIIESEYHGTETYQWNRNDPTSATLQVTESHQMRAAFLLEAMVNGMYENHLLQKDIAKGVQIGHSRSL